MLSRDQILAADDCRSEVVEVPEWGGTVRVAVMSGYARDRFESSIVDASGRANITNAHAKLVLACVIGDDGEPLFSDGDVEALGRKSAVALDRVVKVARRLNRLGQAELEATQGN